MPSLQIKHFDAYGTVFELEEAIDEFSAQVDITEVRYQTIFMNGEQQFTAVATYTEKAQ